MSLRGYGNKRDLIERDVINYFKSRDCKVTQLDKPLDLLVGIICPIGWGDAKELTPDQIEFCDEWNGWPIHVVRSVEQAKNLLDLYGVVDASST